MTRLKLRLDAACIPLGETAPSRYVRRHAGSIYHAPSGSADKRGAPAAGAAIGAFSVVVIDGLAAHIDGFSYADIETTDPRLPKLHLLEDDFGWIPRIQDQLLPDTSWINNLVVMERLWVAPTLRPAGFAARVGAELVMHFGTGCSLAPCDGIAFDPGAAWQQAERTEAIFIGQRELQGAGWDYLRRQRLWIADVMGQVIRGVIAA